MRLEAAVAVAICSAGCGLYFQNEDPPPLVDCPPGEPSYVFDEMTVPLDSDQAAELGFDLDDDRSVDNQLGNIFSAIIQALGDAVAVEFQANVDASIDRGELVLLGSLRTCSDAATFATHDGSDPTPGAAPGYGVSGDLVDETFEVDLDAPPGRLLLPLVVFDGAPVWLELVAARARLSDISGIELRGAIGGAIPQASIDNDVIPALHAFAVTILERDCGSTPAPCGCVVGSAGEYLWGILDDDENCEVPLQEFRENSLMMTLLRADVDTDRDGEPDALSIGVGVHAVAAEVR